MAIPRWRLAGYLDDGVSSYQCLSCYNYFTSSDKIDEGKWTYCPFCGIKWECQQKCKTKSDKYYEIEQKKTDKQKENSRHKKEDSWDFEEREIGIEDVNSNTDYGWTYSYQRIPIPDSVFNIKNETLRRRIINTYSIKYVKELNRNEKVDEFGYKTEYRFVRTRQVDYYGKKIVINEWK